MNRPIQARLEPGLVRIDSVWGKIHGPANISPQANGVPFCAVFIGSIEPTAFTGSLAHELEAFNLRDKLLEPGSRRS